MLFKDQTIHSFSSTYQIQDKQMKLQHSENPKKQNMTWNKLRFFFPTITKLIIPEIKVDVNWLCISLYRESTDWRPGSGLHHENKEMAFEPIENVSLYRKTYNKIGPFRRTHQLKPLQYFKLTSWILFCQQNCITHSHAAKCFQRGQLSFDALCTPQTPTPRDFSPDVSPDVTDCHFLFFFSFFLG